MTNQPIPPDANPYAPPRAKIEGVEEVLGERILAGRGLRLGASLLDGLITGIPIAALIWAIWVAFGFGFRNPPRGATGLLISLISLVVGAGVSLAINGYLLATYGQSVGKRLCKIRIVRQDGSLPSLWDSFVKRQVSVMAIGQIPFLGGLFGLVDILFIFREDRRCLHDHIAGTMVVKEPVPAPKPPTDEVPSTKVEAPPVVEPVPLELCPYCAEPTSEFTNVCRGCGRNPFQVDGLAANRVLTVEELQQKAARLYGHGLAKEALEVHLVASTYHPNQRVAWQGLMAAPNSDAAMKERARKELARIEQLLRG